MADNAITTGLRQVLIDFFGDAEGLNWHSRLLFVHGGGGRWAACSPDLEFEILDLGEHRVLPLHSGQALPDRVRGQCYVFDELEPGQEDELRRQARLFAETVGFATVASDSAAEWVVSDTASALFGKAVPNEALADPDAAVIRDSVGLACIDDVWVTIERVDTDKEKRKAWRLAKGAGEGRDYRLAGRAVDSRGKPFLDQRAALDIWRGEGPPVSFPGPPVLREYFEGLRSAGITLALHHLDWKSKSGVGPNSAACREHAIQCECLRLDVEVDQLDMLALAGAELRVRRLVQIEMAVERNPRAPDYEGLDDMLLSTLGSGGQVVTRDFTTWLAGRQRDNAQALKQGRLLREEKAAQIKQDSKGKDKGRGKGAGAAGDAPGPG